jgi:protein involved in polysaccharide export with SLBB domain
MRHRFAWVPLLLLGALLSPAGAQGDGTAGAAGGTGVHDASRSELEALAAAAEQAAAAAGSAELREQKRATAAAIRARLRDGDFRAGDRIVLSVRGDSVLTDTFTVGPRQTLDLPGQPEIALEGVLRTELREYLALHIGRFVRDPVVDARPLLRIAVLGEVSQPGFYLITPDHLVSDVVMMAGGPTREADIARTIVRRGSSPLLDRRALRAAVIEGATLDQLNIRSGDEIVVGEAKRRNWDTVLRTAGVLSGIALSIYGAVRVF